MKILIESAQKVVISGTPDNTFDLDIVSKNCFEVIVETQETKGDKIPEKEPTN